MLYSPSTKCVYWQSARISNENAVDEKDTSEPRFLDWSWTLYIFSKFCSFFPAWVFIQFDLSLSLFVPARVIIQYCQRLGAKEKLFYPQQL